MKKIIIVLFIFIVIAVCLNEKENILIPDSAIRFRIIANSNTEFDQNLKLTIKKDVEKVLYNLIADAKNIEEARKIITNNLETVKNILKNYNVNYDINFGNNYFPVKEYKGITYSEGNYESLVITLGEGLGNNWWCVLFPPLCLLDEQSNLNDIEYEMYAAKLINKFK
ncbi:MAG: stage II sporulation protein R [Firmicutes bacterium]|nr:stage II sporulation protein R [Bacillota bacterium]